MNSLFSDYIERNAAILKHYKKGMYLMNKHTNDVFKITKRLPSMNGLYVTSIPKPEQITIKAFYHITDITSHFRLLNKTETILYVKD